MEEVKYYVLDEHNNVVYVGSYQDCKDVVLDTDYPVYMLSEIEYNNLNKPIIAYENN